MQRSLGSVTSYIKVTLTWYNSKVKLGSASRIGGAVNTGELQGDYTMSCQLICNANEVPAYQTSKLSLKTNTDYYISIFGRQAGSWITWANLISVDLYPDSLPQWNVTIPAYGSNGVQQLNRVNSSNSNMTSCNLRTFRDQNITQSGGPIDVCVQLWNKPVTTTAVPGTTITPPSASPSGLLWWTSHYAGTKMGSSWKCPYQNTTYYWH